VYSLDYILDGGPYGLRGGKCPDSFVDFGAI